MAIVTKRSLQTLLDNPDKRFVANVVGRGLVVLLDRQTSDESRDNDTKYHNMEGFNSGDAKSGTLTAKYWIKHHKLADWQLDKWLKPGKGGFSRLAKYHRQLNLAAEAKVTH